VPADLEDILAHWGVVADRVDAAPRGTNNSTRLVTSGADRFVLRVNTWLDAGQLEAEARLLDRLNAAGLPFRVPSPLPGADGSRRFDTGAGNATLSRFIPGRRPELATPAAYSRFGTTAGRLAAALAEAPDHALVNDWSGGPMSLVPDAGAVGSLARDLAAAGVEHALTGPMVGYAATLLTTWTASTAHLPRQLVHGDLAESNTLVDDSGITVAVLDFELCGLDLRVQDLVVPLFATQALDRPSWTRALVDGWASAHVLTATELDAIPKLLDALAFSSLLWRARRWRAGTATLDEVASRLTRFVETRAWVRAHGAELVTAVGEFATAEPGEPAGPAEPAAEVS
jgi:Ser/Thr protein kinase RdoA (MazF antagonist)